MERTPGKGKGKGKARSAIQDTNNQPTDKPKRSTTARGKRKEIEPTQSQSQSRVRIAFSPRGEYAIKEFPIQYNGRFVSKENEVKERDNVHLYDNGDVEVVRGPNTIIGRETVIKAAHAIILGRNDKFSESFRSLDNWLREKYLPGAQVFPLEAQGNFDMYQHVLLMLFKENASSIDRETREVIYNHIMERYLDLQKVLSGLLTEELDGEIADIIVRSIQHVMSIVGVHLKELEIIANLAESIVHEPFKEFQLARGRVVRNCINCWCLHNVDHFESEKKTKLWLDNPTQIFSTIDPDKNGKRGCCLDGKAFIIPGLE